MGPGRRKDSEHQKCPSASTSRSRPRRQGSDPWAGDYPLSGMPPFPPLKTYSRHGFLLRSSHTREWYLAITKGEAPARATAWMNLKTPVTEGHVACAPIYRKCPEQPGAQQQEAGEAARGWGGTMAHDCCWVRGVLLGWRKHFRTGKR